MDEHLYDAFFRLERSHWWFVARQQILLRLTRRFLRRAESSWTSGVAPETTSRQHRENSMGTGSIAPLRPFGFVVSAG
jgi:hypothetical protein